MAFQTRRPPGPPLTPAGFFVGATGSNSMESEDGRLFSSFEHTDVSSMDVGQLGKVLLRKISLFAQMAHATPKPK